MTPTSYAWIRGSLHAPWHLVRGVTPEEACVWQHIVAPCGEVIEVAQATDSPAGAAPASKVCRSCHEAAVEHGVVKRLPGKPS